jgi:predicted aldo/keto reductase-like oxidoreductase
MKYRRFGKVPWEASVLGFGCMRLPTLDRGVSARSRAAEPGPQAKLGAPAAAAGAVDENASIALIREAIDRGVNYVDTAYPYHDGQSEVVLGRALRDGYRSKVKLADKSPVWMIQCGRDFDKYLGEQLVRLGVEHIDFYLLHALNKARWKAVLEAGVLERAEAAVRDGRIGGLGFSYHDGAGLFPKIVDGYDRWALAQIQYNYTDTENQAGTAGLRHAAARGLAVVVMEPLLGGRLAAPPATVRALFDEDPAHRTAADWALQWIWDQPEVSVVLSGMNAMDQLDENLDSADRSRIGSFGPGEFALIERVRMAFRARASIPCTKCGYCLPCPSGVNIPRNFELYNDGVIYDNEAMARALYQRFLPEDERSDRCTQCRVCEEKCPQKIEISVWMPRVHDALGEKKS